MTLDIDFCRISDVVFGSTPVRQYMVPNSILENNLKPQAWFKVIVMLLDPGDQSCYHASSATVTTLVLFY